MPALKSRSLFISHSWSFGDAYEKLVDLLDAAPNFRYKNYSVPKDDPVHNAPNIEGMGSSSGRARPGGGIRYPPSAFHPRTVAASEISSGCQNTKSHP